MLYALCIEEKQPNGFKPESKGVLMGLNGTSRGLGTQLGFKRAQTKVKRAQIGVYSSLKG